MKTEIQNMKRLTIAWIVAGIIAFALFVGLIFSMCEIIPLALLVCLIPLEYAFLVVAWRLTVKNARAVSSVLFLLLTLAVPALSGVLICYTTAIISLGGYAFMLLPLCMLVCLIVWYILFFILRKQYSHLIGRSEHSEDV